MNDFILKLVVLLNGDIRMAWCTLYEVGGVWSHKKKRCPKCVAISIIQKYGSQEKVIHR